MFLYRTRPEDGGKATVVAGTLASVETSLSNPTLHYCDKWEHVNTVCPLTAFRPEVLCSRQTVREDQSNRNLVVFSHRGL